MLELLQFVTSGFWVFFGCLIYTMISILCIGWALNALVIGIRGIKCNNPF